MRGHPDHDEMVENDFVEMANTWGDDGKMSCGFGDWCDAGSIGDACMMCPPVGYDYGQYHTYGCLVVPATAENGWNGYRTVYLDGMPMHSTCWLATRSIRICLRVPETFVSFCRVLPQRYFDWVDLGGDDPAHQAAYRRRMTITCSHLWPQPSRARGPKAGVPRRRTLPKI